MNIKDFKWTEKRFGTTFANILKKLGGLSKDGTDGSIEYKDDQGNVTKLVTDSNFGSLLAKNGLIEVKWQELKDKRDSGKLIPGSLYRITDYNCTTTQENTQSAGHQFDIVLLALSENKLAEEGWAMMHDNIYDVTFADGVTKKCWLYPTVNGRGDDIFNIVDVITLLGCKCSVGNVEINEDTKTATINNMESGTLNEENLPYSYFQNSNLSAWKVWYCLDNDSSRFAWADDSLDESVAESITYYGRTATFIYERNPSIDAGGDYGWSCNENGAPTQNLYTATLTIIPGTTKAADSPGGRPNYNIGGYTPAHEGTGLPNGRGVIYRLIDEWMNDVGYDFKNIQYKRKVNNHNIPDNTGNNYSFLYTFSMANEDNNYEILDASVFAKNFIDDEEGEGTCYSNFINSVDGYSTGISLSNIYILPDIVFAYIVANNNTACTFINVKCYSSNSLSISGQISNVSFIHASNLISNNSYDALLDVIIFYAFTEVIDGTVASFKGFVTKQDGVLKKINLVNL